MSNENRQLQKLSELQNLQLSSSARARIATKLTEYAEFHSNAVAINSATKAQSQANWWTHLRPALYTLPVIAVVMLVVLNSNQSAMIDETAQDTANDTYLYESDQLQKSVPTQESFDVEVSSMMAIEPIDIDSLLTTTESRITSLRNVVETHRTELTIDVYQQLQATLDRASEQLQLALIEPNAEAALEFGFAAADLAGQVESELSLLGTITIDPETGAITDIDFSSPPPPEPEF